MTRHTRWWLGRHSINRDQNLLAVPPQREKKRVVYYHENLRVSDVDHLLFLRYWKVLLSCIISLLYYIYIFFFFRVFLFVLFFFRKKYIGKKKTSIVTFHCVRMFCFLRCVCVGNCQGLWYDRLVSLNRLYILYLFFIVFKPSFFLKSFSSLKYH